MKCASCDAVLERTDMPHHIREHHLLPNRHAPRVPRPTVSFGEWQARASTRPAPVITRPQRDTFRSEIEDIVHAFVALPDQLRQACGEGVEKLPVLGALYAYTFTHLQLCAPEKQSLMVELEDLKARLIGEGDACLPNLKTTKDGLVHILQRSQVGTHICNTGLINDTKLHDLDINNIGALIVEHTTSEERDNWHTFYADENAQFMVDILQNLLAARFEILEKYRRYLVNAVIKLSRKSGRFPQSLQLRCIQDIKPTNFRGGFGLIYQGKLNGRLVAVKKVLEGNHSPEQFDKSFSNEAVTWYHVRHANCLPFYGVYVFDDDAEKTWCLVSPWMKDGHVNHYLKEHRDADRYPLILDVARGLEYLHSMNPAVTHGDLKGVNILITSSGRACIADFGIVKARDPINQMTTTSSDVIGTSHFMAPELLAAKSAADLQKFDTRRCDMYALGCVCYEMFTGRCPFQNQLIQLVLAKKRPERPRDTHQVLDDFMWSLIETLWKHKPEERLTAEQVCKHILTRMDADGKNTVRPSTEVEWDVGFLADAAVTISAENPFALAHA